MEKRTFAGTIEIREKEGEKSPKIAGVASVFNSMSDNLGGFREVIAPGAFDDVLNDDVRALFNHDASLILGRTTSKTLKLSVSERGLEYEVEPPDTQYARDLLQSLKRGDISQSSFAFTVDYNDPDAEKWQEDEEGRIIRTIYRVKQLFDVSPVTYPAYQAATSTARSYEQFQKQQARAKALHNIGFKRRYFDLQR